MEATLFDKTFRDDKGNLAIAQKPNLPALTGLTASLLLFTPVTGNLRAGIAAVAYGAVFTWAWLELFQGVNYFRRGLGLLTLVGVIVLQLQW